MASKRIERKRPWFVEIRTRSESKTKTLLPLKKLAPRKLKKEIEKRMKMKRHGNVDSDLLLVADILASIKILEYSRRLSLLLQLLL